MRIRDTVTSIIALATLITTSRVGLQWAGSQTRLLDIPLLEKGRTVKDTVGQTGTRSYRFRATRGQYVRIAVVQQGVDVVERVYLPDGRPLNEYDSPTGDLGKDIFTLVAPQSGFYRVEIAPLIPGSSAGRYEITIVEIGRTTSKQWARADAERELTDIDRKFSDAHRRNNADAVGRLVADEYSTLSTAVDAVNTRKRLMETTKAMKISEHTFPRTARINTQTGPVACRIYGNTGLVSSIENTVEEVKGREIGRYSYEVAHVWQKRNGHWKLIGLHRMPGPDHTPRKAVKVTASVLSACTGQYGHFSEDPMVITNEGDHLARNVGGIKFAYYPESETDYFMEGNPDMRLIFVRNQAGQVTEVIDIQLTIFISIWKRLL